MGFSTCVRFRGRFTLDELDNLELEVTCIDKGANFQTSLSRIHVSPHARPENDVEGLIQFSNPGLCALVIVSLHGLPLGPQGSALEFLRVDGQPLGPCAVPEWHTRIISPLPPGTSKVILLDAVRKYGADSVAGIFYNIGGLVRFTSAHAAKAAEDDAALKKLLILDSSVTELSPRVSEDDLRAIYLNPEKKTRGRLSRYAVVSFSLAAEAAIAIRANNGNIFFDRNLRLFFSDANWGSNAHKANASTTAPPSSSNVPPADVAQLEAALIAEIQTRLSWQHIAGEKSSANPAEQCDADRIALKAERDDALHKLEVIESRRKMLEMDLEMWREKYRALQMRTEVELRELREEQARRQHEQARQQDEQTRRRDEQARHHAEKDKADKAKAEKAEKERLAKEAKDARWRKEEQERLAKAEAARLAKEAEERRLAEEAEVRRRAEEEQRRLEEEAACQRRRLAAAAAEEERCVLRDARWPYRWPYTSWTSQLACDRYMLVSQEFDFPLNPFSDMYPLVARSVPWPVLEHPAPFDISSLTWGNVECFTSAMKGIMTDAEYRAFLKNARLRFHPDKWAARRILQAVADEVMRTQMEEACKIVSQAINDAVREMGGACGRRSEGQGGLTAIQSAAVSERNSHDSSSLLSTTMIRYALTLAMVSSSAKACDKAVSSLRDTPIGPKGAALEPLRADGEKLLPDPPQYSRIISPLPNGTSKAVLLDTVKQYGLIGGVNIFNHIGGLVRFSTVEAVQTAERDAAWGQLLILGEKVLMRAVDEKKLFCTDLSPKVTEDKLRTHFEKHETVANDRGSHPSQPREGLSGSAAASGVRRFKLGYSNFLPLLLDTSQYEPSREYIQWYLTAYSIQGSALAELEAIVVSELQYRIYWQAQAAHNAACHYQSQAEASIELQECEETAKAERKCFKLERTQWAAKRAQLVSDCAQLRAERDRLQGERDEALPKLDGALHKLDVAESRRKMLEMDLEASRQKERLRTTRAAKAERALRDALAEQERRRAEEARAAKAEQERRAKEAAEARRKGEDDARRAQAKRQADDAKRRAEEAEQRRRAEKEEAQRRAKEEQAQRHAEEAEKERQARRRAAAAAEEERCLLRDARWPHRWPFSSFTPMNARDRFLTVSQEFDAPATPFSDSHPLVARSVPWPVLAHPAAFDLASLTWDMVERFTKAMKLIMTVAEYRTFLKNARLRFHPDKWAARRILQAVVDDEMRAQMEAACKTVSQAINDALRTRFDLVMFKQNILQHDLPNGGIEPPLTATVINLHGHPAVWLLVRQCGVPRDYSPAQRARMRGQRLEMDAEDVRDEVGAAHLHRPLAEPAVRLGEVLVGH
ncbi:hypothetical protein K525DRAFT_361494 [Schizophyllum commune Loenen D]|nr:hypothetical protein K525DRAFT_361494 [Schizophyllum commune Loenen D]